MAGPIRPRASCVRPRRRWAVSSSGLRRTCSESALTAVSFGPTPRYGSPDVTVCVRPRPRSPGSVAADSADTYSHQVMEALRSSPAFRPVRGKWSPTTDTWRLRLSLTAGSVGQEIPRAVSLRRSDGIRPRSPRVTRRTMAPVHARHEHPSSGAPGHDLPPSRHVSIPYAALC